MVLKMIKLSVIIPVYNESSRVLPTLDDIYSYLEKQDYQYEVLIVNDGSSDNTVKIVKEKIKNLPAGRQGWSGFKVIDNKKNQGKGAVVKQGMLESQGEWRLFMDADNAYNIRILDNLWPYSKNYEVIIASRYIKGAKLLTPIPLSRKLLSRLGNILIQILVAWGIKDTQCGFKLFSKQATKEIFRKQTMMRWSFDIELVAIAKKHKFDIKEVPIDWKVEKGSKLKVAQTASRTLKDLLIVKWNLIKGKY